MLVSTLLFILIGFMLIVLFSMIPVLWRIRTDYFGIGNREDNNYRRYACDFQGLADAAKAAPRQPGLDDDADSLRTIQPKADPALLQ